MKTVARKDWNEPWRHMTTRPEKITAEQNQTIAAALLSAPSSRKLRA